MLLRTVLPPPSLRTGFVCGAVSIPQKNGPESSHCTPTKKLRSRGASANKTKALSIDSPAVARSRKPAKQADIQTRSSLPAFAFPVSQWRCESAPAPYSSGTAQDSHLFPIQAAEGLHLLCEKTHLFSWCNHITCRIGCQAWFRNFMRPVVH